MTILELGRIASAHDTEIAHAMLHAVAVATARGGSRPRPREGKGRG